MTRSRVLCRHGEPGVRFPGGSTTSSDDYVPGGLSWSKPDEPEAVPDVNFDIVDAMPTAVARLQRPPRRDDHLQGGRRLHPPGRWWPVAIDRSAGPFGGLSRAGLDRRREQHGVPARHARSAAGFRAGHGARELPHLGGAGQALPAECQRAGRRVRHRSRVGSALHPRSSGERERGDVQPPVRLAHPRVGKPTAEMDALAPANDDARMRGAQVEQPGVCRQPGRPLRAAQLPGVPELLRRIQAGGIRAAWLRHREHARSCR
jgi:hypothetical protein